MPPHSSKTQRAAAKAAAEARPKFVVTIDDATYELLTDEITDDMEMELWHQAHLTVSEIFAAQIWPRFMVASIVFLARRCSGELVLWRTVLESIPRDATITRDFTVETATDPKASDGD